MKAVAWWVSTERRRAAWWSSLSATLSVLAHRTRWATWLSGLSDALGRVCLRRSVRIHHRCSLRLIAIYHRRVREQSLPVVLRPSEYEPRRRMVSE